MCYMLRWYSHFLMGVMPMVFNSTFNNISAILLRSVLLVEVTRVPGKNRTCRKSLTNFITMLYRVHLAWAGFEFAMSVIPKVPWTSLDIWSSKGRTFTRPNHFLLDQKKLTQFKCNILFSCIFIYANSFQLHHANLHKSHHHLCHILHVMMLLLSS
jgi:hypothetical protein